MCQVVSRRCLLALAAMAMLTTLAPRFAWAVGGGTDDTGNAYPSACAVLGLREGDLPPRIASGVLIHPRVVLTAGHVIRWFETIWDTPPEDVRISFDLDAYAPDATWLEVKNYMVHPLYNGGEGAGGFGDPHDLGVIILTEAVTGVCPAELPTEGFLDMLKEAGLLQFGLELGTPLSVVGYGRGFSFPPPADVPADRGIRRYGVFRCMGLTPAHIHFFSDPHGVNLQRGDSGGPTFLETGNDHVVLSVFSWTGVGQYVGIDHHYRVDTPDALGFIDWVINEL